MTTFLDTSIVVRYLTDDTPEMAERARRLIEGKEELVVSNVVLAETAWVLTSIYGAARELTIDSLVDLVTRENITTHPSELESVLTALELCRPSGRVSVADALIWSEARSAGASTIYTFDRRFPTDGVEVLEPT